MLTDTELDSMRNDVLGAMPDTITVTRSNGSTIDPMTGNSTANPPTTIYNGPAHVRVPDSYELDILFADVERTKQRLICTFPMGTGTEPKHDDMLTVDDGAPLISGEAYRIVAVTGGSFNLAYRVALEQVT